MAIESTCVVDRKCLRCHMKPASFFLRVLESTERIDAKRHTTEGTELIACVATPRLSMVAVYGGARLLYCISFACTQTSKHSFLWILASRSVGHSVDSKSLIP